MSNVTVGSSPTIAISLGVGFVLVVALSVVPTPVVGSSAPASGQSEGAAAPDSVFGFRIGEERRYVLGPEDALMSGENARWEIKLERIEGSGDELQAVFTLHHVRNEGLTDFLDKSRLINVRVDAELTVNRWGFPLRLVIEEQEDVSGELGSLSDERRTVYLWDGEVYEKRVRFGGREWTFRIPVASQRHLDLDAPAGLYLFWPSALNCLGRRNDTTFRGCRGIEPAFTNPGLLSLVFPDLLEDEDVEREVLFLMARGVGTLPQGLVNMSAWVRSERDGMRKVRNYYAHTNLEMEGYEEIQVGPRTVEAYRIDVGGATRDTWISRDGTVVRLDLDPHPRNGRSRWIRLLFPSEY